MRSKVITFVLVLLFVGYVFGGNEEASSDADRPTSTQQADGRGGEADDGPASGKDDGDDSSQAGGTGAQKPPKPKPKPDPRPEPDPKPAPKTWLVARIVDGDTIELGNGAAVRLVGIDTPERGDCGYEAATDHLAALVLGKRVRLTISDEDTDQYGRLLRYVNVGVMDAGLRQIKGGFALARYDSRDGYGFHAREISYIAADRGAKNFSCPKPVPLAAPPGGGCAPGYSPCIPPYPPDVDCGDVNGPIYVTGPDPHGLDADGDGIACE